MDVDVDSNLSRMILEREPVNKDHADNPLDAIGVQFTALLMSGFLDLTHVITKIIKNKMLLLIECESFGCVLSHTWLLRATAWMSM